MGQRPLPAARHPLPAAEWRFYGGDPGGTRYSTLDQINRRNVGRLRVAWTYRMGELKRKPQVSGEVEPTAFESTPIIVDGVLYFTTPAGRVIALNADTGEEIWQYDTQPPSVFVQFHQNRGVSYWEGPTSDGRGRDRRVFIGTYDGRLIALDAATGKPRAEFGDKGSVLLRPPTPNWRMVFYAVSSPPAIYKDLVITGARLQENPSKGPSATVRAFDVRTGRLVWEFRSIPRPGEPGHETWEGDSWKDRSGTNVWSIISVDVERGIVFLPFGSPSFDWYGGDRKGNNLYGNSLVAVSADSGKVLWHFQTTHHDVWDYDLPAQPVLVTVTRNGRRIPAVAQVTKMGMVFVFDRVTGKPIFPVEERPVPQGGGFAGEATSPTQPFTVAPPPLVRHEVTRNDLSSVTPESAEDCAQFFNSVTAGGRIYTPLGSRSTLLVPGPLGGATWSGASFDPTSGLLYVNVNDLPWVASLGVIRSGDSTTVGVVQASWFRDRHGYPCVKPPWGTLNAVDLNEGRIVWRVPLGVVDALERRGVPKTGTSNLGGTIVTAGGLVFVGGTNDERFRAFDARTGEQLWSFKLDASAHATPMTYLGRTGKQFVVVAAGGGGYFSKREGDALVAFALPD